MTDQKYQKGQRIIAYIDGEWHSGVILSASREHDFTNHRDRWEYAVLLDRAFSSLPSLPRKNEFSVAEPNIRIVEIK